MKRYNIIGDIHGRSIWKDLVMKDAVNIFVGDYFSPYHYIPFGEQKQNFLDIIQYKKEHPQTVLLVGNHDEDHWHICEGYSRCDFGHRSEIQKLFEDNVDMFQVAYSIENQILVTHAGVSALWYNMRVNNQNEEMSDDERLKLTPDIVAQKVNELWKKDPITNFSFRHNSKMSDYCGTSEFQSPMWIRHQGLEYQNIFKGTGYIQVYGHTINDEIVHYSDKDNVFKGQMYMIDCLQYINESLLIEYDDNMVRRISHLQA